MPASASKQLERLQHRYHQLALQIPEIGFILKGSVDVPRMSWKLDERSLLGNG